MKLFIRVRRLPDIKDTFLYEIEFHSKSVKKGIDRMIETIRNQEKDFYCPSMFDDSFIYANTLDECSKEYFDLFYSALNRAIGFVCLDNVSDIREYLVRCWRYAEFMMYQHSEEYILSEA